jgi:hypothetical protein
MRTSALPLCLARLRFNRSVITIPSLRRTGAGIRLLCRLRWLIAWLFCRQFVASLAWVLLTFIHCIYVRMQHCVRRITCVPFRRLLSDVRRECMKRLFVAFHGTLGSYLRDALSVGQCGCCGMPLCPSGLGSSLVSSFYLVVFSVFTCKNVLNYVVNHFAICFS